MGMAAHKVKNLVDVLAGMDPEKSEGVWAAMEEAASDEDLQNIIYGLDRGAVGEDEDRDRFDSEFEPGVGSGDEDDGDTHKRRRKKKKKKKKNDFNVPKVLSCHF
jgi:hypothetical protein